MLFYIQLYLVTETEQYVHILYHYMFDKTTTALFVI